jgi:hypothetical protein
MSRRDGNKRMKSNLQTLRSPHQPSPARAECGQASINELGAEAGEATKRGLNQSRQSTRRLSSSSGLHALPVEGVVEALGGVVEQSLVVAVGAAQDGHQVSTLKISALDHGLGSVHVLHSKQNLLMATLVDVS